LCDLKSTEPDSSTAACLSTLKALLHSPKARITLTAQSSLGVEVCNVLHRVILTKKAAIQQLAFDVLLVLVQAAQEQINRSTDPVAAGEGGIEGELLPGTSLVFAALEVCLCLFVQFYPKIDPSSSGTNRSNSRTVKASTILSEKSGEELLATALEILRMLPSICSPQGALSLLPALLHLVTNILKESGILESLVTQTGLRCLRTFCCHPYSKLEETTEAYSRLLQSCAARLLDWGKAGQEEDKLDSSVLLSALTEMLLHAEPGLLSCAALLYPCLNAFQQSIQSADPTLRLHTIRLFGKLLQEAIQHVNSKPEEAKMIIRSLTPYVHALAPKIVTYLCNPLSRQFESQQQLMITIESLNCVEALATLTETDNCM